MKDSKGCVSAKYVGLPIYDAKKNAIWVTKTLVTNIQGPKKIWVPKRVTSLLWVNYKAGGRHWVLDSGCTQHMTGDPMMFSSLDENVGGYSDIIFGDNSRAKSKELVQFLSQAIILFQKYCWLILSSLIT